VRAAADSIRDCLFDFLRSLDEWREIGRFSGGNIEGATPVPIPNTEVKPFGADGTAWETVWESRSPPELIQIIEPAGENQQALLVFGLFIYTSSYTFVNSVL
jgi:hypothetical protein